MTRHQEARRDWHPGDDPTTHPLWTQQVELEQRMLRAGADHYAATANKARDKGQMTRLGPHRQLIKSWVPTIVVGIEDFIRDARAQQSTLGGAVPTSLSYLETIDKPLAAYLTLRHVLDTVATRSCGLLRIARRIGSSLEHEAQMRAWEKMEPELYYEVRRGLKRQKATPIHKRRVNINRFNALVKEKVEWEDWSEHARTRIGMDLIDILVRYTKQFEVVPDPFRKQFSTNRAKTPMFVLLATHDLMGWIIEAMDREEVMSPVYMPTLIPPKRWQGIREGGYYTPYVRPPKLIRYRAYQETQRRGAADEYDALAMPEVYAALHSVQEVPWRVNKRVYDVAVECWERDLALGGLPVREGEPLPPEAGEEASDEEIAEAKRARARVWGRNARKTSEVMSVSRTLAVAGRFQDKTFYFPHMLDFRGRMYPIPVDFQPQGRDIARGLLTFAEGGEVGEEDIGWLAIHLANCFGHDKETFDDRIAWTEARNDTWRMIAQDPLEHRDWADADAPWQALAAIFEWVSILDHGAGFVSHLPVRVDATCSGLQHLSALTRDKDGGALVNLTPSSSPQDIYKDVARKLTQRLADVDMAGGEEGGKARWWIARGGADGLPRSLTKRPVMIVPYGGTRHAFFQYILDWLVENRPEGAGEMSPSGDASRSSWLAKHLWDVVKGSVSGGVKVMAWIQQCAKAAAEGNQPIYWVTPDGFVVRHFYGKMQLRRVRTRIDGQDFMLRDYRPTGKLDVQQQLKGISPNYIHSFDACTMRMTVNKARRMGITSVTCIHDALGALAGDMWPLYGAIRTAFIDTHEPDLLGQFRSACGDVLAGHLMYEDGLIWEQAKEEAERRLPKALPKGKLRLEDVAESDYFFT